LYKSVIFQGGVQENQSGPLTKAQAVANSAGNSVQLVPVKR